MKKIDRNTPLVMLTLGDLILAKLFDIERKIKK